MKSSSVDLDQMLAARERRVSIQNKMLTGAGRGQCLVCLTLNIAGDIKRTPLTYMLFAYGVSQFEALGLKVGDRIILDEATGSEAFWLAEEAGEKVKPLLEALEDSFPAARLYDFDVIVPGGSKLSRKATRKCLVCDGPAAVCARSRNHGLDQIREVTGGLLKSFCAERLAGAAVDSLIEELRVTPKPGLVDMNNCGAHRDMDAAMFERSARALKPYFEDAARMGIDGCGMQALRARGIKAEAEMFAATGGVNTHKGLIYSMGLLLAGMGKSLAEGGSCTEHAAALATEDAAAQLKRSQSSPDTNGGAVYKKFGAKGATGEAAAGFPDAQYCLSRLLFYKDRGKNNAAALALCDCMARLEDTNLLHRGGMEGLMYVRREAARISGLDPDERLGALNTLDRDLMERGLSPGGSADMLALALLLERWQEMSAAPLADGREDK